MTRGRRPKPTHLKLVEGNAGKRPINTREPKPKRSRPAPPSHLTPDGKKIWVEVVAELDGISILTTVDVFAIEVLVSALEDHRAANAAIARARRAYAADMKAKREPLYTIDGRFYHTTTQSGDKMLRANPAIAMKSDADKRIRGWCAEFGLTPSARTRLTVGTGGGTNPAAEQEDDEFGLG